MATVSFLDTNILVYAAAGAKDDHRKWRIAHNLIEEDGASISAQVLQEFYVNVTRPGLGQLPELEVRQWIERLLLFPAADLDFALVLSGIAVSKRYRIAYWDGAIIAAAERLGAETLYTEDLNHGQSYGSVRVINPFRVLTREGE